MHCSLLAMGGAQLLLCPCIVCLWRSGMVTSKARTMGVLAVSPLLTLGLVIFLVLSPLTFCYGAWRAPRQLCGGNGVQPELLCGTDGEENEGENEEGDNLEFEVMP